MSVSVTWEVSAGVTQTDSLEKSYRNRECGRLSIVGSWAPALWLSSRFHRLCWKAVTAWLSNICPASVQSVCLCEFQTFRAPTFSIYKLSAGDSNLPGLCCSVTEACHRAADEGNMLSVLDGCFWRFGERQMAVRSLSSRSAFLTSPVSFAFCFISGRSPVCAGFYFSTPFWIPYRANTHLLYCQSRRHSWRKRSQWEIAQVYFYRSMRRSAL